MRCKEKDNPLCYSFNETNEKVIFMFEIILLWIRIRMTSFFIKIDICTVIERSSLIEELIVSQGNS